MSRIDTAVLQAVTELKAGYGLSIWHTTKQVLGHSVSIGAIYVALEALEEKGLVRSYEGEATPVRGGRRKRYYMLAAPPR